MTRGFLLGKFMPPHRGHEYLCRYALELVDQLTVLVCSRDCEPISGHLRYEWMREIVPTAQVKHVHRDVPQVPEEHPDFWNIWREIVREFHPESIDYVFASESYGHRLASELGAVFVPGDPGRLAISASGTSVRDDPLLHWDALPCPVRPYYAKRVCVFGPESTGKTTLANRLANKLKTQVVPEYGRIHTEQFGLTCTEADLVAIGQRQQASARALARDANRVLVLDTDSILTAVWAEMLLGVRPRWFESQIDAADLYLLLDVECPWTDDGTRYFPNQAERARFYSLCERELIRRGVPFVRIGGDWDARAASAWRAVLDFLGAAPTAWRPNP